MMDAINLGHSIALGIPRSSRRPCVGSYECVHPFENRALDRCPPVSLTTYKVPDLILHFPTPPFFLRRAQYVGSYSTVGREGPQVQVPTPELLQYSLPTAFSWLLAQQRAARAKQYKQHSRTSSLPCVQPRNTTVEFRKVIHTWSSKI